MFLEPLVCPTLVPREPAPTLRMCWIVFPFKLGRKGTPQGEKKNTCSFLLTQTATSMISLSVKKACPGFLSLDFPLRMDSQAGPGHHLLSWWSPAPPPAPANREAPKPSMGPPLSLKEGEAGNGATSLQRPSCSTASHAVATVPASCPSLPSPSPIPIPPASQPLRDPVTVPPRLYLSSTFLLLVSDPALNETEREKHREKWRHIHRDRERDRDRKKQTHREQREL